MLKRVEELKEKIKTDEIAKKKLESQLKEQLAEKENLINKLKVKQRFFKRMLILVFVWALRPNQT